MSEEIYMSEKQNKQQFGRDPNNVKKNGTPPPRPEKPGVELIKEGWNIKVEFEEKTKK